MRLLYLYPEEWVGTLARELYTMATCVSLAESGGVEVTLVIGGGEAKLLEQFAQVVDPADVPNLRVIELSRTLGPIQSTAIFSRNFAHWARVHGPFDLAFITHLKAGPILSQAGIPYAYEAHRIYTQGQPNPTRQQALHKLEGQVLSGAKFHIATSAPLATALNTWFGLSKEFSIVPGASLLPLEEIISAPFGPFVYCGAIGDGTDLGGIIQAAQETRLPLKVVGGTDEEWRAVGRRFDTKEIEWLPQIPLHEVADALNGCRAGLIPTNADSPAGEYSCPTKLFDYARCGLQVISTGLPTLKTVEVGDWCTQVWCTQLSKPALAAWTDALRGFIYDAEKAEAARVWAGGRSWAKHAEMVKAALGI